MVKTIVAFANGEGGYIFVGVSNDRDAFGLTLDEIDKTKNLVALVNDRHIFPMRKSHIVIPTDMTDECNSSYPSLTDFRKFRLAITKLFTVLSAAYTNVRIMQR